MKWYSVKDFAPIHNTDYVVVTESGTSYIALSLHDDHTIWVHHCNCGSNEESGIKKIYCVTHFAIIEPVPIVRELKEPECQK